MKKDRMLEVICDEIDKIAEKGLTTGNLETAYKLIDMYKDSKTPKILDGAKVIVCKLNPHNQFGMASVAFPVDMTRFPKWFKDLPFDEQSMKESVVEKTIESIFGVLDWDLSMANAMNQVGDLEGFLEFV